jgi:hypothetical protein
MPFKENNRMEERIALMRAYDAVVFKVTGLCERFQVNRDTFYAWWARRDAGGARWFEDKRRIGIRRLVD